MSTVGEMYKRLRDATEETHHLVLASHFKKIFGRKLRRNEWGHLRKLIKLYGPETMFEAMLMSSNINSEGSPLSYIAKVCIGISKKQWEKPDEPDEDYLFRETEKVLKEMKEFMKEREDGTD